MFLTKAAYEADEAFELLSLKRTQGYQLVREGEIGSIRVGRKLLIPASAIQDFIERRLKGVTHNKPLAAA